MLVDIDLSLFPVADEDMFYAFTNMQTEKVEIGNKNVSIKMTIKQARKLNKTLSQELKENKGERENGGM